MKQFMYHFTSIIQKLCVMLIGATIVVSAQAMGSLPFYGDGRDLSKWLAADPRVGMWLYPGYVYLIAAGVLIFLAVAHGAIAHQLGREIDQMDEDAL